MNRQSAFTLLEVLIVLAIILILAAASVPGLNSILQHAEDNAVRRDILRIIRQAHARAQVTDRAVVICKSADQHQCGGDWSQGMIALQDNMRDGVVHDKKQIIATLKFHHQRGQLHAKFFPYYRNYIRIQNVVEHRNDNGTLWYCRRGAALPVWALRVNRFGIARVEMPDKNGEIKDHKDILRC